MPCDFLIEKKLILEKAAFLIHLCCFSSSIQFVLSEPTLILRMECGLSLEPGM